MQDLINTISGPNILTVILAIAVLKDIKSKRMIKETRNNEKEICNS